MVLDCERKTSFLALKPTIDEIHDRTENEENTEKKISMKNVLYEPGKYHECCLFLRVYVHVKYACMHAQSPLSPALFL